MSAEWERVELEQLTEADRPITYGVIKPGEQAEDGVTFVRGGDLFQGRIALESLRTITPELSQIYKRTILRGGELLISLVGNPGEVAIAPPSLEGANIARQVGLIALRPDLDSRFVMYFLMSPVGRAELFTRTGGAVQQVINLADLKTVKIPVPSIEEQRQIAATLSAYDDLIENNQRRMALLEEAARQLYTEWFVRLRYPGHEQKRMLDGLPAGWERKFLGEMMTLKRGHDLPSQERIKGDIPVVSSSGITGFHNAKKADAPGIVTGRYGTIGEVYYIDRDYWPLNTALYVSDFKGNPAHFLFYTLKNALHGIQSEKAAIPGLNRNVLHTIAVLCPPMALRGQFNEFAATNYCQISLLETMNQKLRTARDLLLPRLMSGEIAV